MRALRSQGADSAVAAPGCRQQQQLHLSPPLSRVGGSTQQQQRRQVQCQARAKTTSSRNKTTSSSSSSTAAGTTSSRTRSSRSDAAAAPPPPPQRRTSERNSPQQAQLQSVRQRLGSLLDYLTPKQEGDIGDVLAMSVSMAVFVYLAMQLYRLYYWGLLQASVADMMM